MRILIAALLSAALIGTTHQAPPVKNLASSTNVPAVRAATTEKVEQKAQTEPQAVANPEEITVAVTPPTPTTHEELMAAAGIQPEDYGAVDYIISHESSWDENATEPTTGAHGLPQALPYSKTNCGWSDAVCQLAWANTYAVSRYGGWWSAYSYWVAHRNW